jgi:RNA polymerase subunit RPABC4/transcription elongation factor Spt4
MRVDLGSILMIAGFVVGFYLLAFTLSMTIWTFRDIRSRTRDIFAQLLATLLVLIFNMPGLILYFILRPQETLEEAYQRSLEEEALLQDVEERDSCPGCKRAVEPGYLLCPHCHTQLKRSCPHCGRLLDLRWDICPYCGGRPLAESPLSSGESSSSQER